jgi:hypothetical protein
MLTVFIVMFVVAGLMHWLGLVIGAVIAKKKITEEVKQQQHHIATMGAPVQIRYLSPGDVYQILMLDQVSWTLKKVGRPGMFIKLEAGYASVLHDSLGSQTKGQLEPDTVVRLIQRLDEITEAAVKVEMEERMVG